MVIHWRGGNLPDMSKKLSIMCTEGSKTPKNYFVIVKCWQRLGDFG